MIDRFTQKQFESALPIHKTTGQPLWESRGFEYGELVYYIPIDSMAGIIVRSSIDRSGLAAATGEDSIRAWLTDNQGQPLGSKVNKYTTRVTGWDARLKVILRQLWGWRKKAGNCSKCMQPLLIFKVNKPGPNKGRVFAKCDKHNIWMWLDA